MIVSTIDPRTERVDLVVEGVVDPEKSGSASTLDAIVDLGRRGLLQKPLPVQVRVISAIARHSVSIAFSAWAHRMVVEYVDVAASGPARSEWLGKLASVELIGSTAMAPALRANLGLGPVGLNAIRVVGGYRVTGKVNWASNLHVGRTLMVAAAQLEDGSHVVGALEVDGASVKPGSLAPLLGLDSTASASVAVDNAFLPDRSVLSRDLGEFLSKVRPQFLILQAALGIGLGEAALSSLDGALLGADVVLGADRAQLLGEHGRLVEITTKAVDGALSPKDLIAFRLSAAKFAQEAVAAESRKAGGRGYIASSGTARRLREAAFLPIQSPTENQLKWELARA